MTFVFALMMMVLLYLKLYPPAALAFCAFLAHLLGTVIEEIKEAINNKT